MSLRDAAIEYAEAGWRIFPIKAGGKRPPLTRHGHKDATSDPAAVRHLWTLYPGANIGIATGDGLGVIDVDFRSGGAVNPAWPETLTARTPSGGLHLYYGCSEYVRNSASRLAPGVDVRGDGGYVVGPPSTTDAGEYEWVKVQPITPAAVELFLPDGALPAYGDMPAGWAPYDPPDHVAEGARNTELLRYAGWLWRVGFDEDDIEDALADFNESVCHPPLPDAEVLSLARRCRGWER